MTDWADIVLNGGARSLRAEGLLKRYPQGRGAALNAVDGVDLELRRGEILGLVGESGCGKSTLARLLLGLVPRDGGSVSIDGLDPASPSAVEIAALRRSAQIVFQNPRAALNPALSVGSTLRETARFHHRADAEARVLSSLARVGLGPEILSRKPRQLSGGQLQRIGIARALLVEPSYLIADEAVSSLDVSVQAQVLNLFSSLRAELGLALLFITHDLRVVEYLADRVLVMYRGRIVEEGPCVALVSAPQHPYTRALLAAVPELEAPDAEAPGLPDRPAANDDAIALSPGGCSFAERCPLRSERCLTEIPVLRGGERRAACHAIEVKP